MRSLGGGALVVVTVAVVACFSPSFEATQCGADEACPAGLRCTPLGLCASCGDGVTTNGEACDDGNQIDGDDCRADCSVNVCGDHVVDGQGPVVEECDEGGVESATCDGDCTLPRCGDLHVNALYIVPGAPRAERCDDGNLVSGDGCAADCASTEICGDDYVNDDLPNNRDNMPLLCGNASAVGTHCAEVCDDGNDVAGDGCSSNCLSEETCGNGIFDPLGGIGKPPEVCDDGDRDNEDECRNDCQGGAGCGNGIVDSGPGGEQCDSGLGADSAECDGDCTIPWCGDGRFNMLAGEACDPGAPGLNVAGCNANCTISMCGDGFVNAPDDEDCDPGPPGIDVMTCDRDCTNPVCGDGLINNLAGETCDDGNLVATDNCPFCQPARCGDGIVDLQLPGIETCDDANSINTDACPNDCTIP